MIHRQTCLTPLATIAATAEPGLPPPAASDQPLPSPVVRQFEGPPFYPNGERPWQIVDKYSVSKFYTAPTAIRALMRLGDGLVTK